MGEMLAASVVISTGFFIHTRALARIAVDIREKILDLSW
jgi:hypothetical protein